MELTRLVRASGFFLSAVVTLSLGILLFEMTQSDLISLSSFAFIIPLFVASILLRGLAWKKIYEKTHDFIHIITAFAVPLLGIAVLIAILIYASSQTVLYYLSGYGGITLIFGASLFWAAYSLLEFVSLYKIFGGFFRLTRFLIFPIFLAEASLALLIGQFDYILPISMFMLTATSLLIASGFLFDEELSVV